MVELARALGQFVDGLYGYPARAGQPEPESVTRAVMSIGAPQSGHAGRLPSWTRRQYRQRYVLTVGP